MDDLKSAEENAAKQVPQSSGESSPGGLYTGSGVAAIKGAKAKIGGKGLKVSAGIFLIFILLIVLIAVVVVNLPSLLIGTIDFNLQRALGFDATSAILEKQAEYVTAEMLANGRVPENYANDLAANGVEVGQVTLMGDFVRTNSYIADLDNKKEIAATGKYYNLVDAEDGALAVRFKDKIIKADEFVAAVESDSEMYAAYSGALDIDTRFYYSKDVDGVYEDMGLSRNAFSNWVSTGDAKKDEESFWEILRDNLDEKSSITVNGYDEDGGDEFTTSVVGQEASKIVDEVASKTRGQDATGRAAQLLNSAISAEEPYRAAATFVMVEEAIQQARIEGTGPVNEVMGVMTKATEVTYTDVETNELVTEKKSPLETTNFVAAVSGGSYSKKEAANFSRDRVLKAADIRDSEIINGTTVATDGHSRSNIVLRIFSGSGTADSEVLSRADSSVSIALEKKNSELLSSVVGGSRIIGGGSFFSDSISSEVLGAMASDAGEITKYNQEVGEVLERRMKADQVTSSPFDISSPYTFLGSLVHSFAMAMLKNSGNSSADSPIMSTVGAVADLTDNSVKGILGEVVADGENDSDFATMMGDCTTVKTAANVEGDLYCTAHHTISTKYMKNTKEDWENSIVGNSLDDSGKIKEESDLGEFIALGMGREATVGVKSADVCERWRSLNGNPISNVITKVLGLYESCVGVEDGVGDGSKYTLSNENSNKDNIELYSGYVLYDTVYSILSEKQSNVAVFKEGYYSKYPKDNSAAGRIARISGMSKEEAGLALDHLDYLNTIATYQPSAKFKFGNLNSFEEKKSEIFKEKTLREGIYYAWCGRREFADVRNRNFVV